MAYSTISGAETGAAFTIAANDVAAFRSAADMLARLVIEKRNTIPIAGCIAICAMPDGLELFASDLDIFARVRIAADVQTIGGFAVDAQLLRDIVRKADKGAPIAFAQGRDSVKISDGRADMSAPFLPYDDMPSMRAREFSNPLSWESDAATLSGEFGRLSPAISTEETRYYLNGIYAHCERGKRIFAATNGHIAAVIERGEDQADNKGGIIPRKVVALAMAIAKAGAPFSVSLDDMRIEFTSGAWDVRAKMIDGYFPDYQRPFPAPSGNVLSVASADMVDYADCANKAHKAANTARNRKAMLIEMGERCRSGVKAEYARPLSGEYRGEAMTVGFNPDYLKALASGETMLFNIPAADSPCLVTDPAAPEYRALIMPMRIDGARLPDEAAIAYPEIIPPPGRAADLFSVEPYQGCGKGSDKPRKAADRECIAYLTDYAKRCGLPMLDGRALVAGDGGPKGLTVGEIAAPSYAPVIKPGEYAEGAYCIPMPGRNQPPVTVETMGEDGQWSAPAVCSDAQGSIMLPDAPKARKARKAKISPVEREEASSAPQAALKPENAPQTPVSGEIDPIAELTARLDAAEAAIAERPRIRVKAIAVPIDESPSVENVTVGPWAGARERLADRDSAASERAARERARRERIVRAYLKMRRERDAAREDARDNERERLRVADLARVARDKRRRAVKLARRHWKMRLVARGQYQAAERDADRQRAARHASALTGRALAMKARGERDKLAAYRDRAADQYNRVAAERDAAKRMLADARDKLATAERERDAQAHAIAALASRVERVEAAAVERRAA